MLGQILKINQQILGEILKRIMGKIWAHPYCPLTLPDPEISYVAAPMAAVYVKT